MINKSEFLELIKMNLDRDSKTNIIKITKEKNASNLENSKTKWKKIKVIGTRKIIVTRFSKFFC